MANDFNRPWTMQEMIDNSDNWNLAGDVGILQSLKSFANTVITKSTDINNKLNHLNNNLSETKLKLNLAQNKLHCLRNSQFIESRVYEDDETLPLQEHSKEDLSEKLPADSIEFTKRFGKLTLSTINNFFDRVEVTVSDTEDEDDNIPNYIFRRKDLYLDRPLPYVIGSEEWYKKWHVGLEDSSSDSESEKISEEKFSESSSDAEFDDLEQNHLKANLSEVKSNSDTSSEIDFQNNKNIKRNRDVSSGDDTNSVQSFKNKNFAEQLAEKLGNVINEDSLDTEVNTRPIQVPEPNRYGNLFFDEPPPLNDDIVKKPSSSGLFSSGPGLFDDDDGELEENKIETLPKKQQRDLFNEESSDDDHFSNLKSPNKSELFNEISSPPLVSEEPPELDKKKKPIGGVSVFGNVKIGANKLIRRYSSSEDEEEKSSNTTPSVKNEKVETKVIEEAVKKISLFDDEEDKKISENEPPAIISQQKTNKTTKALFDEDDDDFDIFKSDLFSSNNKKFTSALFDDEDEEEEDKKTVKVPQKRLSKDLFEESDEFMNKSAKTEEIPTEKRQENATKSSEDLFGNINISKQKTQLKMSLFDSPPPIDSFFDTFGGDNDDLFADIKVKSSTPETVKKPNFMQNASLFDPTPPEDEWDTKSEEVDEKNDFLSDEEVSTSRRGSFYDIFAPIKEPEIKAKVEEKTSVKNEQKTVLNKNSLFSDDENESDNVLFSPRKKPEEKTATKALPSKIKHNLNINVSALMPGSGPPKQISQIKKDPAEKMASYFDTVDNVQVLHSLTKDRVRGVRRRPSSKKGRRAALQRSESNSDFENVEQIQNTQNSETIPPVEEKIEKTVVNINKKAEEKPKKVSLFDEDDSDGELFSKTAKSNDANSFAKRSLFEDEDSDDDFFKTASASNKSREVSTAVTKKIQKNNFKKIKSEEPADDDPLSALLK